MKKILCLLLALCCVFSFVACNGGDDDGIEVGNPLEEVVAASAPTKIVTLVSYVYPEADPRHGADLDGNYVLEIEGSNSIFTYDFNTFATPEEGLDSWIKTVSGTIYVKNGAISNDGEDWEIITPATIGAKFNLDKTAFKTYEKSEDEKTLTATITGINIESVLGYKIAADGDVTVVITTDGFYMRGVTITYKSQQGANVTIDTSYSYNKIALDFPGEN